MSHMRTAERGFTLIELIVVITIIGIIGTMVAMNVIPMINETNATKVKHDLQAIVRAAKFVAVQKGSVPVDWEELRVHFEQEPLDPWNHPYIYEVRDGLPYASCLGKDQIEGGEGDDMDWFWPAPQD